MQQNEIIYMTYFEKNLLNKTTATFETIRIGGDILGMKLDVSCPSCAKNAWYELLNRYNGMLVPWNLYKESLIKPIKPIHTKYEEEEIIEEIKTKPKKPTISNK